MGAFLWENIHVDITDSTGVFVPEGYTLEIMLNAKVPISGHLHPKGLPDWGVQTAGPPTIV